MCPPVGVVGSYLYRNQLSGSIPVELGRLTVLTELYKSLYILRGVGWWCVVEGVTVLCVHLLVWMAGIFERTSCRGRFLWSWGS